MGFGLGQIAGILGMVVGGTIGYLAGPAGSAYGITIGMTVGGMIGGMAGSQLFPDVVDMDHQPPPQLKENRVQIATYGASLAKVYGGGKRLAGIIFWMSDILRTSWTDNFHEGDADWDVHYERYTASFAVAISEPVTALSRIWLNNKLFADFRDPNGEFYPSGQDGSTAWANFDTSDERMRQYFTIYPGSEADPADPVIAAAVGAANCPGYRDCCKIVFRDFPVGELLGLPNVEVEAIKAGSTTQYPWRFSLTAAGYDIYTEPGVQLINGNSPFTIEGNIALGFTGYPANARTIEVYSGTSSNKLKTVTIPAAALPGYSIFSNRIMAWGINPDNGDLLVCVCAEPNPITAVGVLKICYDNPGGGVKRSLETTGDGGSMPNEYNDRILQFMWPTVNGERQCWVKYVNFADGWQTRYGLKRIDTRNDRQFNPLGPDGFRNVRIYKANGTYVTASLNIWMWADDDYIYFFPGSIDIGVAGSQYYVIYASPAAITHTYNRGELVIPWGYGYWAHGSDTTGEWPVSRCFGGSPLPAAAWFGAPQKSSETGFESVYRFRTGSVAPRTELTRNLVAEAAVSLKTVFEQICTDAQIPAASVNAAALASDAVLGYGTARQTPARSIMEPLLPAYSFDVGEIDDKLVAVKRGGASVATITTGELGVVEGVGVAPGNRLLEVRPDPQELPTHLTVNYESKARDYDNASQNAARVDKPLFVPMTMALPLVMTDEAAKRQSEVALNALWASRCKYRFVLGPKYLYLSPTDVITVGGKSMRITAIHYRGLMMEVTAESEDGGNYQSAAVADSLDLAPPDLNIDNYVPSLLLLQLPTIEEGYQSSAGIYAALYGRPTQYRGGTVRKSTDGGATWADAAIFDSATAKVGACEAALGSGDAAILDYTRSLSVDFSAVEYAPASITDAQLWAGGNLAAVGGAAGWEIVQFKTATQVAGYRYTLTGLRRGLYGTGWMIGAHGANEQIVMLEGRPGLRRVGVTVSQAMLLQATTPYAATGVAQGVTPSGVSIEPYAPAGVNASRNSSRDLIIRWSRRDRMQFDDPDLRDYMEECVLSEASESYEIEIRNAGDTAAVRTLTATTNTVTYTAANQTTDFGSIQNSIKVRVYQISATAGRGYAAAATL